MCSRLADWVKMSGAAIVTNQSSTRARVSRTMFLPAGDEVRYTRQGSPFTSGHAMQPLAVPVVNDESGDAEVLSRKLYFKSWLCPTPRMTPDFLDGMLYPSGAGKGSLETPSG